MGSRSFSSIDFFGLERGDGFKVYFDEQYVDTNYVGLGKIHGAVFMYGKPYKEYMKRTPRWIGIPKPIKNNKY